MVLYIIILILAILGIFAVYYFKDTIEVTNKNVLAILEKESIKSPEILITKENDGEKSLNIMYGKNNGKKVFIEFIQGSKRVIDEINPSEYFMKIYREIGSENESLSASLLAIYDENMKNITSEFNRKK